MLLFNQKKNWKHNAPLDFQNILENQTFQKIAKFIIADFYKMDFMKSNVILVKVNER